MKEFTLRIPKLIAKAVGFRGGYYVKVRVEGYKILIVIEHVLDLLELALNGPKFAKIEFNEFERESEEMQDEIFSKN